MGTGTQLVVDGLLVAGFGVQHSGLATIRVKRAVKARTGIEPIAWRSAESLCNVVYILVAASLWQYTDVVIWNLSGAAGVLVTVLLVASWLWYWQLHLFEYDCGLAFGSTTLVVRAAGAEAPKLIPWKVGTRRWIRFPVHTAFFGMFLLMPRMTADLMVLAIVANVYNVVGSILYDKRLLTLSGDRYKRYVDVTGLIWPPVYRMPRGAADLTMSAPQHWRRPVMHLPGLIVGVGLGLFYFAVIGPRAVTPMDMLKVAGAGLAGAILSGGVLGILLKPKAAEWSQQQTDLSTTVALNAATGVVVWAASGWLRTGLLPNFAAFLPLWFTVQYLGHVFAFLVGRRKWSASTGRGSDVHDDRTSQPVGTRDAAAPGAASAPLAAAGTPTSAGPGSR